ncbi:hypothetical protein WN943_014960 [Citrus x changshan-huyou]
MYPFSSPKKKCPYTLMKYRFNLVDAPPSSSHPYVGETVSLLYHNIFKWVQFLDSNITWKFPPHYCTGSCG